MTGLPPGRQPPYYCYQRAAFHAPIGATMTDLHGLIDAIAQADLAVAQAHQDLLNCTRAAERLRADVLLDAYMEPADITGKNEHIREMQETVLLDQCEEYQEAVAGEDAARFALRVAQLRRDEAHRLWQAALTERRAAIAWREA